MRAFLIVKRTSSGLKPNSILAFVVSKLELDNIVFNEYKVKSGFLFFILLITNFQPMSKVAMLLLVLMMSRQVLLVSCQKKNIRLNILFQVNICQLKTLLLLLMI